MVGRRRARGKAPKGGRVNKAIDWRGVGTALAAVCAAAAAAFTGMNATTEQGNMPRVTYVQIRELKELGADDPKWKRWSCKLTYRDDAGRVQREAPVTVDIEGK